MLQSKIKAYKHTNNTQSQYKLMEFHVSDWTTTFTAYSIKITLLQPRFVSLLYCIVLFRLVILCIFLKCHHQRWFASNTILCFARPTATYTFHRLHLATVQTERRATINGETPQSPTLATFQKILEGFSGSTWSRSQEQTQQHPEAVACPRQRQNTQTESGQCSTPSRPALWGDQTTAAQATNESPSTYS